MPRQGDLHAGALADLLTDPHKVAQAGDGDAGVLGQSSALGLQGVVEHPPALHEEFSLGGVVRDGDLSRAQVGEGRGIPLDVLRGVARAVGLHEQGRLAARGEAEVVHRLDGRDRGAIEELQQRRSMAIGAEGEDCAGGLVQRVEGRQCSEREVRRRDQAHQRRRDDAQGAFRADEQAGEVIAGGALRRALPGADLLASGEDDLQRLDVVGGHAVLDAAQAACVGGHVAADRAGVR